jgi:23S rRNA pseudouridine1911/1915/1917 synthase
MKKMKVLFENKSVMVVDKPAGLSVFGSDYSLVKDEKEKKNSIDKKYPKYFVVHRLDKETSGCLVLTKNEKAANFLKQQFQNKQVKKEYEALVWGWPKYDTGIIDLPIARSKTDFRKKQAVEHSFLENIWRGEERFAVTRYKVVKRGEVKVGKGLERLSLVKFYPETGRTHQIRVHAKSLGHPIVADHLYGPAGERAQVLEKKIFKTKKNIRQLLHAERIVFTDPETGGQIKVESELPKELVL